MKKRNLFIILITILIVVTAVVFIILHFNDRAKYTYDVEYVSEINYNIINKEDRYGVIDKQGKVIVEPIYDIIQIPNPSKPIFICMSNYDVDLKEYQTKVLDENGNELYQGYNFVQAIPNETAGDGIPFEKTVLKYKKDGKYGLITIEGKEILPAEYDQISSIAYKEGMLLVKQEEKLGVINIKGKTVIDIKYNSITADNYYSEQSKYKTTGFIVSEKKDDGYKYGYINYKGKRILDTIYTEVERVTELQDDNNVYLVALKDGQAGLLRNKKIILNYEYEDISYNLYNDVFVVQRNGKQGIADGKGNIKIGTEYDNILFGGIYINAIKDGELYVLDLNGNQIEEDDIISKIPTKDEQHYIVSDKNEKYKIVDKDANIVVDNNYSYIEEVDNNYYIVASGSKNGIVDLSGKSVVELKYNSIFQLDGTELLQANISSTNTVSLINKDMKIIATADNAMIKVKDNFVVMYLKDGYRYFDFSGNELSNKEAYPNNLLYAKQVDGKWGFVDQNGNLKVQNEYEMVTEFNSYGFAGIKKDGMWGSIDSNGNIVQEPVYKLNWNDPEFIGKFYRETEWYGDLYYTDKIAK